MPFVLPSPRASLRVKIEQTFFRHGLNPRVNIIETSSFLTLSTFEQECNAAGFFTLLEAIQL